MKVAMIMEFPPLKGNKVVLSSALSPPGLRGHSLGQSNLVQPSKYLYNWVPLHPKKIKNNRQKYLFTLPHDDPRHRRSLHFFRSLTNKRQAQSSLRFIRSSLWFCLFRSLSLLPPPIMLYHCPQNLCCNTNVAFLLFYGNNHVAKYVLGMDPVQILGVRRAVAGEHRTIQITQKSLPGMQRI